MVEINDKLRSWIKEHEIDEVEALVPDMTGNARGKIIPAYRFLKGEGVRLPEAVFMQTVTGEWPDPSLYRTLIHPSDRDMFLRADPGTVCMVPWAEEPTAQIIHDCVNAAGEYHPLAPRTVLRSVLQLYADDGLQPIVAPEVEFYLVEKNTDADYPLRPPVGRSGRPERARQSYSIDAVNEFDPLFEEMYDFAEVMKLDVDTLIHESGAAQMEVNFEHADALSRADQVFLFKRLMREVAMRNDVFATFLAKPMENEPGSSMHIHQSVNDLKTGRNIFEDTDDGKMNSTFRHYIGGLQKYTPAAMIFYAPYVNSYRRLIYGDSAPVNVHWGIDNRTGGLRVPVSASANRRIESRFGGSDVNPYLAIAATLACGYLGMKEKIEPTQPTDQNAREMEQTLPHALEESLICLEQEPAFRQTIGENFSLAYAGIKRREYETFFRVISSWEREYLLLNV
ncbi:MAG: glutamine synthetase family protein [Gammaproteobacteria bacterium]|nr:glutamine synthetase family protein [Gammaproteobacteria bacterium]